ncbi:MAG TPA: hypothetical protein VHY10_06355 [Xanthobacteraceae bacterium]|nr:hypothetical protein [Xanthobacteraceae bacterium]
MSTQSITSRSAVLRENVRAGSLGRRLIETLREWHRRTQSRHELAMLSEIERKDLGYPERIQAEIAKPFWRA